MTVKYNIGDTIQTAQDYNEVYTGTIVDIKRYPNACSTSQNNMTWYTITTPQLNVYGRNYTFITSDIEHILVK